MFSFKQYLGFVTIGIIDLLRAKHCKKSGVSSMYVYEFYSHIKTWKS